MLSPPVPNHSPKQILEGSADGSDNTPMTWEKIHHITWGKKTDARRSRSILTETSGESEIRTLGLSSKHGRCRGAGRRW